MKPILFNPVSKSGGFYHNYIHHSTENQEDDKINRDNALLKLNQITSMSILAQSPPKSCQFDKNL